MKAILLQDDIKCVEDRLKLFEKNTGCELLLIIAKSSDEYPAAIWRFGIISGFVLTLSFSVFFEFNHGYLWPLFMLFLTLVSTWVGGFSWAKRWALSDEEIERETMEKAVEKFHTLGTSQVSHKVTAMIMVSLLEKRVIVLVDEKLKSQITQAELDELIAIMRPQFRSRNIGLGLIQSIESLEEKILKDFGGKVSDVNPAELKDTIYFL